MDIIDPSLNIRKGSPLPIELSPQVRQRRYANFSRSADRRDAIFMAGYEVCSPNYCIERHTFPFWTMEIIVSGHGFFRKGNQFKPLSHGSILTYGPDIPQHFSNEQKNPFRKYFLVKKGRKFPARWHQSGLRPGSVLQLGSVSPLVGILDQMIEEGHQCDAQTADILSGLETVFLAKISRHQGKPSGDKSASRVVYDLVMEIILEEYRNLHSLSDLARRSGYSSEYLCRIFRKYRGESPYQVLLHRKMSAAWLLLRDGQFQVSAVARELGYDDPLHFSRVFRKIMGCAPSYVKAH